MREHPRIALPLHIETVGSGGVEVILLHGFGTNRHTWRRWLPRLSRACRVHVVDLKGFGAAPKPDDDLYTLRDQASFLSRWIRETDRRGVILAGHSLGGGVALLAALDLARGARGHVRGLALLAGIAYPQPISRYLRILGHPVLGPLLLRILPRRAVIRTALRMAYHPSRPVSDFHVQAYTEPLRTRAGRRALSRSAARLWTPDLASAIRRYHEIDIPTLLLWGAEDRVVPLWVGERLASALPQARLEVLAECGHMPQEEVPEASLDRFLRFMTDQGWSGFP